MDSATFSGQDQTLIRERRQAALVGLMSMNLHTPPAGAYWGRFNDRPLDKGAVRKLLAQFQGNLSNCTDSTAVDIVVKKRWLANAEECKSTVEGLKIGDVPELTFTEEGAEEAKANNVWMMGGHHRHHTLKMYLAGKKKEIEKMAKELKGMGEGSGSEAAERERMKLRERIEEATKAMESDKMWAVRVFDRGKPESEQRSQDRTTNRGGHAAEVIEANQPELATATFRFLSRNEVNQSLPATPEERLLEIVNELRDAYEVDLVETEKANKNRTEDDVNAITKCFEDTLAAKVEAFKTNNDARHLCTEPSFAQGLVMASRVRRQYTHSQWFTVKKLNEMLAAHGAVSGYVSDRGEDTKREDS